MGPWTGEQCAFAMKAFYKNGDSFVIAQREFQTVRDSSQSCCSISPCHQDLGSKLWGYWFYTREERWWCKNNMHTREYCGSERGQSPHFCALPLSVTWAVWSQLQQLKHQIQQEVTQITVEMLQRVMGDVHKRLAECLERNGGQLNDVIFGT